MRRLPLIAILLLSFAGSAQTVIDNDASCDISLLPAATLLLPYFEVDITSAAGMGENTIFTVTNVSQVPQIARVTLWTDLAYPIFTFNIYLTGYDVQSISLYDVIARGAIAGDGTGFDVSPVGRLSGTSASREFNNPIIDEQSCTNLPVQLPASFKTRMQWAFTTGKVPAADSLPQCNAAGGVHDNAVGYATIDVVGNCASTMPTARRTSRPTSASTTCSWATTSRSTATRTSLRAGTWCTSGPSPKAVRPKAAPASEISA